VRDADAVLFALVEARHGYVHDFLREHLAYGHPDLSATIAHFEEAGASVVVLPNGYLPYWSLMQTANLLLAEPVLGARYADAQARYNGRVADRREPAYRHLLVIDLSGARDWCRDVRRLVTDEAAADAAARRRDDAAALSEILTLATTPPAAESKPEAPLLAAPSPADARAPVDAVGAARGRAHPFFRAYDGLRHLVRQLAGSARA
jgi:hypothetical protein